MTIRDEIEKLLDARKGKHDNPPLLDELANFFADRLEKMFTTFQADGEVIGMADMKALIEELRGKDD